MRKFIILAQPRTGSTLMTSLIQKSAPKGIRCINEPINPVGHKHHMKGPSPQLIPQEILCHDITRALDICFEPIFEHVENDVKHVSWIKHRRDGHIAAGFKIMAHQIEALPHERKFWEYLHRHDVKTIIITRNNILMQWISDLIVKQTRQCVVWKGPVIRAKVEVPLADIEYNLDEIMRQNKYLLDKSASLDRRILCYEDFKDNHLVVEESLPWLLGIKYAVSAQCKKQNSDALCARVTNYEQLRSRIIELGLEQYLTD